jgi:hypothetical protein
MSGHKNKLFNHKRSKSLPYKSLSKVNKKEAKNDKKEQKLNHLQSMSRDERICYVLDKAGL